MRIVPVFSIALGLACTGPALADTACHDEIATLQRRLDSAGAQKVTDNGKPAGDTPANPSMGLEKSPSAKPSDKAVEPSAAGIKEARDLVAKASQQDKAGDAQGCRDSIMQAKKKAGALP